MNANYLRQRIMDEAQAKGLDHTFTDGVPSKLVKHEFTLSLAAMKVQKGIGAMDIAKGLLDRG